MASSKTHTYSSTLTWTGNKGEGTSSYRAYERSYTIQTDGKALIEGSSDPAFRGDPAKHNPEELLLYAISSCHMLSYLHLCAVAGIVVTGYSDRAVGEMEETPDGGGHFTGIVLYPEVSVADEHMIGSANALHEKANELCFIANSVNFKVKHEPTAKVGTL